MGHKGFVGIPFFKTKRQNYMNHVDFLAMGKFAERWPSKVQIKVRFTLVRM